jgi:hypothetical protein
LFNKVKAILKVMAEKKYVLQLILSRFTQWSARLALFQVVAIF